jgi:hypothetical protein
MSARFHREIGISRKGNNLGMPVVHHAPVAVTLAKLDGLHYAKVENPSRVGMQIAVETVIFEAEGACIL